MFARHIKKTQPPLLAEIWEAVLRLLRNNVFMFHVLGLIFQILAHVGFFAFSPKYMESQFRVTAATSNLAVSELYYFQRLQSGIQTILLEYI
jgi:hypothetical protein